MSGTSKPAGQGQDLQLTGKRQETVSAESLRANAKNSLKFKI